MRFIEVTRNAQTRQIVAVGSLLTDRRKMDWMYSPTGRSEKKRSGFELGIPCNVTTMKTEYMFDMSGMKC